jgi:hypothetical protein
MANNHNINTAQEFIAKLAKATVSAEVLAHPGYKIVQRVADAYRQLKDHLLPSNLQFADFFGATDILVDITARTFDASLFLGGLSEVKARGGHCQKIAATCVAEKNRFINEPKLAMVYLLFYWFDQQIVTADTITNSLKTSISKSQAGWAIKGFAPSPAVSEMKKSANANIEFIDKNFQRSNKVDIIDAIEQFMQSSQDNIVEFMQTKNLGLLMAVPNVAATANSVAALPEEDDEKFYTPPSQFNLEALHRGINEGWINTERDYNVNLWDSIKTEVERFIEAWNKEILLSRLSSSKQQCENYEYIKTVVGNFLKNSPLSCHDHHLYIKVNQFYECIKSSKEFKNYAADFLSWLEKLNSCFSLNYVTQLYYYDSKGVNSILYKLEIFKNYLQQKYSWIAGGLWRYIEHQLSCWKQQLPTEEVLKKQIFYINTSPMIPWTIRKKCTQFFKSLL